MQYLIEHKSFTESFMISNHFIKKMLNIKIIVKKLISYESFQKNVSHQFTLLFN